MADEITKREVSKGEFGGFPQPPLLLLLLARQETGTERAELVEKLQS
jgi:hypothetical protein